MASGVPFSQDQSTAPAASCALSGSSKSCPSEGLPLNDASAVIAPYQHNNQQSQAQPGTLFKKGLQVNMPPHTIQPEPASEMKYATTTEKEIKQKRRQEQIHAVKSCCGKTYVVCGKSCIVMAGVMVAVCNVAMCMMSWIPGDSPGFSGGGAGLSNFGMSDN
ncbi:hypothetical protein S40288_11443 [Stachybotrys chartarum IBT 40288]|nr:hypothetical protein S40288_11443 [Stachybotrys chartarum IBT 40288]